VTAAAIGGTSNILFLGLILLLIRYIRIGFVLFEVVDKSDMDPNRASDGVVHGTCMYYYLLEFSPENLVLTPPLLTHVFPKSDNAHHTPHTLTSS